MSELRIFMQETETTAEERDDVSPLIYRLKNAIATAMEEDADPEHPTLQQAHALMDTLENKQVAARNCNITKIDRSAITASPHLRIDVSSGKTINDHLGVSLQH